jgi:cytochrome c oxidase subunit IV
MNAWPVRTYLLSWLALLALLTLTVVSAYFQLGTWNITINLGVATLKALIVIFVFMHLARSTPLLRLVAAAGFIWLAILTVLTLADVLTRPTAM